MLLINDFKSVKLTYGLVFALMLSGCGGSGDGEDVDKLNTVTDVSGRYTMITSAISIKCTDGSTDTAPAIAISGTIEHIGNRITFFNDDDSPPIGGTIIEEDENTDGIIESDGKFILSTSAVVKLDGISGNITLIYTISGYFNDTGWRGTYFFTSFISRLCYYLYLLITFFGNKKLG